MKKIVLCILYVSVFCFHVVAQQIWPAELIITPEKTNFEKTSTSADVISFINAIKTKSANINVISMGKSQEGKDIPVAILAKPLVRTPEEAKASGKPVIYIQGNIHAGEIEGKEAVLMLMRDILLGNKSYLLDNLIILFCLNRIKFALVACAHGTSGAVHQRARVVNTPLAQLLVLTHTPRKNSLHRPRVLCVLRRAGKEVVQAGA